MKLIIISGPSATGKTTVGMHIAKSLDMLFVSKDAIKEQLFDTAGKSTHRFFWYENRAKKAFFETIDTTIRQSHSVVIESNFLAPDIRRIKKMINHHVEVTEIYCYTTGFTAFKRYVTRVENRTRHSGHHDRRWYATVFIETIWHSFGVKWPYPVTGLTERVYEMNTTNFSKVDYEKIMQYIETRTMK